MEIKGNVHRRDVIASLAFPPRQKNIRTCTGLDKSFSLTPITYT